MAYPEKVKRNDHIMELRQKGLALREIARVKQLHVETVREIIQRREKKAASGLIHSRV